MRSLGSKWRCTGRTRVRPPSTERSPSPPFSHFVRFIYLSHARAPDTACLQKTEISELEALRRDLREREWESGTSSAAPKKKDKVPRLPPGPFADINAAGEQQQQQQEEEKRSPEEDDGAEYTRDGLRLASPKRPVQPPKPVAAVAAKQQPAVVAAAAASKAQPTGDQQTAPSVFGDADLFSDGAAGGVTAMADLIKASIDGQEDDGEEEDGGGFDWEEGYEDVEGQVAAAASAASAAARMSPSEAARDGGASGEEEGEEAQEQARPMIEAPAGGYPKRLAGMMSFCRVSDKATCEILVEMGRVTVNGVVATDPGIKVDLLTDIVVANGEKKGCCVSLFLLVVREVDPSAGWTDDLREKSKISLLLSLGFGCARF